MRGLSHIGFPASAGSSSGPAALAAAAPGPDADPAAARRRRKQEREQRTKREQLLANGLVTRPEGNREHAREMDRERYKRAEKELAPRSQAPPVRRLASQLLSNIQAPRP